MRLFLLCYLIFFAFDSICQKNFHVSFLTEDYKKVTKKNNFFFKDSVSAINYLSELQSKAIDKGYLCSSIDTLTFQGKTLKVSFYLGEIFQNAVITINPEDKTFLRRNSKAFEKVTGSIPFGPSEINRLLRQVYSHSNSNGYPFSKVYLEKISYSNTVLKAELVINKGKRFTYNAIHIKGDSSISSIFISSLIDIKSGDLFDESKLSSISKKIKQLSFIREIKTHELLFTDNGVELFLYLESNPVSSINGAIGLQPNPISKRIGLAGELNLKLLNIIKHGELISVNWRSIQEQTQSLNGKVNFPFLFKTPFGIDGQFQLYKRDSSFLELKSIFGVQYFLKGGNYLKVFYQNNSSNILSGGSNNPNFSNLSTLHTNAYGLSIYRKQMDYIPNPSKGLGIQFEIAIGSRKSQINDTVETIKTTTYRSSFQLDCFVPISPRNIVHFVNATEFYYAPIIFQNETFRMGGQNSLRGFNEEELYATLRSVFTLEYRFLIDQNSHVFAFFDQGFYENNSSSYYQDHPFGFGAGFSFGTNIGIFSISYALGKQFDNPILMRNGKIHFGYIAYF